MLLDNYYQHRLHSNNHSYSTDKEDRQAAILALFDKKKQELDPKLLDEEVTTKLKNLKIDSLFDEFFTEMGWSQSIIIKKEQKKRLFHFDQLDLDTGKLKSNLGGVDVEKEMRSSVLQPGIEKEHEMPSYDVSKNRLKAIRRVCIFFLDYYQCRYASYSLCVYLFMYLQPNSLAVTMLGQMLYFL